MGLTHERLYVSYIFEIAKLKHSKCDGGYLVTIVTQAAPLYPLGPCLTQFMSHTQKTWLVFQGRVYQFFGIFIIIINVTNIARIANAVQVTI